MKSYKIPVNWSVTATMEIEAESLEDAILQAGKPTAPRRCPAEGGRLSTMPDYLDGSFEVDMALLERHAACESRSVWLPPRRAILLREAARGEPLPERDGEA